MSHLVLLLGLLLLQIQACCGWRNYKCHPECVCSPSVNPTSVACRQPATFSSFEELVLSLPLNIVIVSVAHQRWKRLSLPSVSLSRLPNLENVSLSYCGIEEIEDGVLLEASRLKFLDLSHNWISNLTNRTFEGLRNLDELYMENNLVKKIPQRTFKDCLRLRKVSFTRNQLTSNGITNESFSGLVLLQTVFLEANKLGPKLAVNFSDSPQIKQLWLWNNNLKEITESTIYSIPGIEELELSNNLLYNLADNDFSRFRNLKALRMYRNSITDLPSQFCARLSNLERLGLSYNNIHYIKVGTFEGCRALTDLSIANNAMKKILPNTFDGLSKLRILRLNGNGLANIEKNVFSVLKNLKFLDLSSNALTAIDISLPSPRLETFNVSHNEITTLHQNVFRGNPLMRTVILTYNQLRSVDPIIFSALLYTELVDLRGNKLCLSAEEEKRLFAVPGIRSDTPTLCHIALSLSSNQSKESIFLPVIIISVSLTLLLIGFTIYKCIFRKRACRLRHRRVQLDSEDDSIYEAMPDDRPGREFRPLLPPRTSLPSRHFRRSGIYQENVSEFYIHFSNLPQSDEDNAISLPSNFQRSITASERNMEHAYDHVPRSNFFSSLSRFQNASSLPTGQQTDNTRQLSDIPYDYVPSTRSSHASGFSRQVSSQYQDLGSHPRIGAFYALYFERSVSYEDAPHSSFQEPVDASSDGYQDLERRREPESPYAFYDDCSD